MPKITKKDAFFLFQSQTSIFHHDEEPSFMLFPGANKARTVRLQSPKFTMVTNKTKDDTAKKTSNVRFQNLSIRNHPRRRWIRVIRKETLCERGVFCFWIFWIGCHGNPFCTYYRDTGSFHVFA
jgi:hypothetical protein